MEAQSLTPAAAHTATLMVAELISGGLRFGVNARQLLQVVNVPPAFSSVPRAGSSLVGVFEFRRRAVPVVDLRRWQVGDLPVASALAGAEGEDQVNAEGTSRIAVLAAGDKWVGVLVSNTGVLYRLDADAVQRLHHDDDPNEFFSSVIAAQEQGQWLPLMDVSRLMERSRVWSGQSQPADEGAAAEPVDISVIESEAPTHAECFGEAPTALLQYAVVGVADRLYGFPLSCVATVLQRPAVQTMKAQGSDLLGFMSWRDQQIPLMRPARMLGGGGVNAADGGVGNAGHAAWVLVLRYEDADGKVWWLALTCDQIDQVRHVSAQQIEPAAALGDSNAAECRGYFSLAGARVVRLMDAVTLVQRYGMASASKGAPDGAGGCESGDNSRRQPNKVGYLAFRAGKRLALPVDVLQEVLPFDSIQQPAGDDRVGAASEQNAMVWRGRQIPLMDLRARLGEIPHDQTRDGPQRVLVAKLGDHLAGLVVGAVDLLMPAYTAEIHRTRLPNGQALAYITTSRSGQQESCHLLDLDSLAF